MLLSELNGTGFADDVHFNRARILHGRFNLSGNVAGQLDGRQVVDLLRLHKYPHFAAGLMFMHHLGAGEAAANLQERTASLEAHITKLTHVLAELRARGLTRLSLIEVEHKIAMLEAERDWVSKLQTEITAGKLEWVVGIDSGDEKLRRKHGASAN